MTKNNGNKTKKKQVDNSINRVVDMLYFPIYVGETFTFFNAIFNGADSFITIGVILLFIFNKQAFPPEEKTKEPVL